MSAQLIETLQQIARDRDLDMKTLLDALCAGIKVAYQRQFMRGRRRRGRRASPRIMVMLDPESGDFKVLVEKTVVEEIRNPGLEISLENARAIKPDAQVGERIAVELPLTDFSRSAMQIVRQEMMRRIQDAEQRRVYQQFRNRVGDIITAEVRRVDRRRNVYLSSGKTEILLPVRDQLKNDSYRVGERIKVYVRDVRKPDGRSEPLVRASRVHKDLVRKLFELEVPEIRDGVVQIKAVAREPGARTKVAVASNDPNVDPVGACIGQGGKRVNAIVSELRNEHIDVVPWSNDPIEFLINALSPAQIDYVILNEDEHTATVIVRPDQLSLAIGKGGRNVSLAAKLTGWRIDIRSHEQVAKLVAEPSTISTAPSKAEVVTSASADAPASTDREVTAPTAVAASMQSGADETAPSTNVSGNSASASV